MTHFSTVTIWSHRERKLWHKRLPQVTLYRGMFSVGVSILSRNPSIIGIVTARTLNMIGQSSMESMES